MLKICTILGARPQFIKSSVFSKNVKGRNDVEEIIIHTGQHFNKSMSDIFFEELDIPDPHYKLNINSLSHGAMTGRMLEEIEKILVLEKPDVVLVYGDTNSTLSGALAAKKLGIKVAHVEAGLRSFNMAMPEEINRVLTDRISDYLFVPTKQAKLNLIKEGFENSGSRIYNVGDIMLESSIYFSGISDRKSTILKEKDLVSNEYALASIHRAENTDDPKILNNLSGILSALNRQIRVVFPIHPRTEKKLKENSIHLSADHFPPVGYLDMIQLIKNAKFIITDSGGLQKEAFFFGKYCITLREETEWVELVEEGYNFLVGNDIDRFEKAREEIAHSKLKFRSDLYGDGNTSSHILNHLLKD